MRLESVVTGVGTADACGWIAGTIEPCASPEEVEQALLAAFTRHGYTHYLITNGTPSSANLTDQGRPLFCNWPSDWLLRYMEHTWAGNNPFISRGGITNEPFVWSPTPPERDHVEHPLWFISDYCRFAMGSGVCITSCGTTGSVAGAILSGRHADLTQPTTSFLQAALLLARDKLARLRFKQSSPTKRRLSNRERQILTWTALGKSAWDISCILGISEVTAHKHVSSAMKKLNSVNKAHAVATALLTGEICL
jgi:LuxR family quorum sensing-dependent transcriptional regulator